MKKRLFKMKHAEANDENTRDRQGPLQDSEALMRTRDTQPCGQEKTTVAQITYSILGTLVFLYKAA